MILIQYEVENCPAILPMTKLCDSENLNKPSTYCKECTDCVMKQIYDLCNHYKDVDIVALQVAQLLQIEEVE